MNRIYVFFTWFIYGIGGTQLYLGHKVKYLRKEGWKVYIVSGDLFPAAHVDGLLDNLLCEPAILFPEYYFFSKQRHSIINRILSFLPKEYSECIIESHCPKISTWAESVAQLLLAKHIIYNNDEEPHCQKYLREFFQFKLKRKEIAGISYNCSKFFINQFSESLAYNPELIAWGAHDCIRDVTDPYSSQLIEGKYTIALFGRLHKTYIKKSASEICKFVKDKKERFNIIYIGGEEHKQAPLRHKLEKSYRHLNNVNLIFTGSIYPVPRTLIRKANVCISGSGSAVAMTQEGIPTICVDPRDCKSSGVLGVSTMNWLYSIDSGTPKYLISQLLEDIYANPQGFTPKKLELKENFEDHFMFIHKSSAEKKYNVDFVEKYSTKFLFQKLVFFITPASIVVKCKFFIRLLLIGE